MAVNCVDAPECVCADVRLRISMKPVIATGFWLLLLSTV
jgi:hypothetical protein